MARMQSAAKVIQDELKQARQAVAFYSKRVEDLEDVLTTITNIDAPVSTSRGRSAQKAATKKGVPTKAASAKAASAKAAPAKAAKTGGRGTRSATLPATGKDFWPNLLTDKPQSSAEVFKAALAALRIRPNPEDRKKLLQRMSNALSVLAKDGQINAEGGRRTRLYSKKADPAAQA